MAPSALVFLLAAVAASALSGAAAQTYTGPAAFSAQDTNPGHTLEACTASAGCVPLSITLTIKELAAFPYSLKLPSGRTLKSGTIAGGTSGALSLLLPWGKYPVTLAIGGAAKIALSFTVTGFTEVVVGPQNAFASDAKMGLYGDLRWSYYALQANNSAFTPGVAQPFWTGSATHYHEHCYWRLALDPLNKNNHALISFAVMVMPYYSNGKPNYEGSLLDQYPTRTTNQAFAVTIGDAPFYTGPNRRPCGLVGKNPATPNWAANIVYRCDPTFPARYLVATATQAVNPTDVAPGQKADDYATKLALHFVRYFAPLYPTYAATNLP